MHVQQETQIFLPDPLLGVMLFYISPELYCSRESHLISSALSIFRVTEICSLFRQAVEVRNSQYLTSLLVRLWMLC